MIHDKGSAATGFTEIFSEILLKYFQELLGKTDDTEEKDEGVTIQRDEELIRVLDKMILYLRIVHSVDFYNHSEYPNEDEMPNRSVEKVKH